MIYNTCGQLHDRYIRKNELTRYLVHALKQPPIYCGQFETKYCRPPEGPVLTSSETGGGAVSPTDSAAIFSAWTASPTWATCGPHEWGV